MSLTKTYIGYDPGGNGAHGLAIATYLENNLEKLEVYTCETAKDVIDIISKLESVNSIGIDTLTCWSTGHSGWRPADKWLKKNYPQITNSIASPNSLFGSMGLNGMSVLLKIKALFPRIIISETHPKVLYFALSQKKYNYKDKHSEMDIFLEQLISHNATTKNDHEWDAIISIYAAKSGADKKWINDLHLLNFDQKTLVEPVGKTFYWWP